MFVFLSKSVVRLFNAILLVVISLGLAGFGYLIGWYNYDQTISDLINKTENTAQLARISLKDPIWNIDEETLESIIKAITRDKDVVGLQVEGDDGALAEIKRGIAEKVEFDDLKNNADNYGLLYEPADVIKENETIGKVHIVTSKTKAVKLIKDTSIMIAIFTFSLILAIGFVTYLVGLKFIKFPINKLKDSALKLAGGDLDYPVDTSRMDELGDLAQGFADMRDSIKKTIEDLHVLNETGEQLAGMHDQNQALEKALEVMEKQTNVVYGSVYLPNKNNELEMTACYPKMDIELQPPKTFKMGEGIAGKVAQNKKVIFIPDTSKDSKFVVDSNDKRTRALLCIPMMDEHKIFGVMNFSGEVGQVRFENKDEEFALTIARLTVVTTKNIQMLNVIEEQNRTLEQKVLERTSELRQKTNDIQNMLQNMHQGIFTIIEDNKIHHEYSSYLENILETKDIAYANAMELLFDKAELGSDTMNQLLTTMGALVGEDEMMFEFNSHLLVNEYKKVMPGGNLKTLELDWDPIVNDEGYIEKIMVTVRDVTEIRKLQEEAEHQKRELEIIGEILSVSQDKFTEFLSTSHKFIEENEKLIQTHEDKDPELVATLFRNMHTVKGNARTYGFKHLTDVIHETEQTYDSLRKEKELGYDKNKLLNELHAAEEYIEEYEQVFNKKLQGLVAGKDKGVVLDKNLFSTAQNVIKTANTENLEELQKTFGIIENIMDATGTERIEDIIEGITSSVPSLAAELGKPNPNIIIQDNDIRLKSDYSPIIKDVFMHVFRNSMDHGIEIPEEREKAGKTKEGNIVLELKQDDKFVHFYFHDDGKGLGIKKIREKAISNGLITEDSNLGDEEIAQFIFESGISTATTVTNVSGRGVGMDAIKRFLQRQGGDIKIHFANKKTEGDEFRQFFQIISLPIDTSFKVMKFN